MIDRQDTVAKAVAPEGQSAARRGFQSEVARVLSTLVDLHVLGAPLLDWIHLVIG